MQRRQTNRQKKEPPVFPERITGNSKTLAERESRETDQGGVLLYKIDRCHGGCRRNQQKGELLQEEPPQRLAPQPVERIPVKHQQHEREADARSFRHERHGEEGESPAVVPPPPALAFAPCSDIAQIQKDGAEGKESVKHILSFRYPGDRLHPQRVQAEKQPDKDQKSDIPEFGTGNNPAEPSPAERVGDQHDQGGIEPVQSHVVQMIADGVQSPQVIVESKRYPGKRHPPAVVSPGKGLPCHAQVKLPDERIDHNVDRIVLNDEFAAE